MGALLDQLQPVAVADRSTIGVGGTCPRALIVDRAEGLAPVITALRRETDEPVLVLGACSNLVVADAGVHRPVVFLAGGDVAGGISSERVPGRSDRLRVTVDGAVSWDALVERTADAGLAGLELLSGIPGTVGAAPVQNISAYGRALADVLDWVETVELATGATRRWSAAECGLGYRASTFRSTPDTHAIVRVGLVLTDDRPVTPDEITYRDLQGAVERDGPGVLATAAARRAMVLRVRRRKSMVVDPVDPLSRSLGSFFVSPLVERVLADKLVSAAHGDGAAASLLGWYSEGSQGADEPVKVPAAVVLLATGFRNGDQWGPVRLSDRHVLALVNAGGATATDVHLVAQHIRATVTERCGVPLSCEPRFVGDFPAYEPTAFARTHPHRPGTDGTPAWVRATLGSAPPAG